MKCALCNQRIQKTDKYVRLIVEETTRDEESDGSDPFQWSRIEDWIGLFGAHSSCVRKRLSLGQQFKYDTEFQRLFNEALDDAPPRLGVVEGGKL